MQPSHSSLQHLSTRRPLEPGCYDLCLIAALPCSTSGRPRKPQCTSATHPPANDVKPARPPSNLPARSSDGPRPRIRWLAGWSCAYVALAIAATWPVARVLTTHLPHDLGDPVLSLTLLQWNATTPLFTSRWWDGIGFYPLANTLTFSDPRLGASLLSTPILWATGSAVAGYNVVFILSVRLLRSRRACARTPPDPQRRGRIRGRDAPTALRPSAPLTWRISSCCSRGGCRWRSSQRTGGWKPGAAARWRCWPSRSLRRGCLPRTTCRCWACCWRCGPCGSQQAGCRPASSRSWACAALLGVAALAPLLLHYWRVHEALGLYRDLGEIQHYSADISSIWSAAPDVRLWPSFTTGERRALSVSRPHDRSAQPSGTPAHAGRSAKPARFRTTRRILASVALGSAVAAARVRHPWAVAGRRGWGGPSGGVELPQAAVCRPCGADRRGAAECHGCGRRLARGARSRFTCSPQASCSCSPLVRTPTLFEVPILYKPPYSWLMLAPGFEDSLRAPARFGMVMALALAVAAGLAWHQIAGATAARGHPVADDRGCGGDHGGGLGIAVDGAGRTATDRLAVPVRRASPPRAADG